MEKVLVTGASGFIGSHICEELLKSNYKVIAQIHTKIKKIEHLRNKKNFKIICCDLLDQRSLYNLLKKEKIKGVFHLVALHTPEKIDDALPFFESNFMTTLNLLEVCRKLDIKKIIYSSTMSVYGSKIQYLPVNENHPTNPETFYALSKYQGEELCKFYTNNYKFKVFILRYSGVYGIRRDWGAITNFVKQSLKNKPIQIFSNLEWDIVYVKDVAKANILAYKNLNNFDIVNIGSGKKVHIKDVARTIIKLTKSKSRIITKKNLSSFEFYYDIKKAKNLLGFRPKSLIQGLNEYIKEVKKVGNSWSKTKF